MATKRKKRRRASSSKFTRRAVTPGPRVAQIDLDRKADLALFKRQFYVLNKRMELYGDAKVQAPVFTRSDIRRSSNKGSHWHVEVISSAKMDNATRIALQAVLGSDRKRELLSLCRHLAGSRYPTLFFERRKCK